MAKVWLEIERVSGKEKRSAKKHPDYFHHYSISGECPGCKASPFLVKQVTDLERLTDNRTLRAGSSCADCNDPVGYLYHRPNTIFGVEEDQKVLGGPWKVY